MGQKIRRFATLAGSAVIAASPMSAISQDAGGGFSLTAGISSTLRFNDNLTLDDPSLGSSTIWDNRLTLGFSSETANSRIGLDLGTTLRGAWLPGQPFETSLGDSSAVLQYSLESADSIIETEIFYREVALSFADPFSYLGDDDLDGDDLSDSAGRRIRWGGSASFETGRNNPFGFGASVDHTRTEYVDTTDTALSDNIRTDIEAFARLQFSPVMEGRIALGWDKYDAEDVDETSRTTRSVNASLDYEINAITRMNATLGYVDIEETTLLAPVLNQEGVVGSVSITRDFPRGNVSAEINSELTSSGRRNNAIFSGSMDLPSGSLGGEIGVTRGSNGVNNIIGGLDYSHALPAAVFTASLDRAYSTDLDGDDTRTTRATLGVSTELNRVSTLALGLNYAEVFDVATSDVTEVTGARATYTRSLTEDWTLSAGYEYSQRSETGDSTRSSNELFLTLEREFTIR